VIEHSDDRPRRGPLWQLPLAVSSSVAEGAALAGILVLAAVVRFIHLSPGLFDDEVYSVEVSRHGLGGILRTIQGTDTHPPLSYFVLHFWMQVFGTSEAAVRSLAAAWSLGTVVMIYLIGRLLWSSRVGLIAALLLAFSQFNVSYAHFARMYSMMGFLTALSFYFLARLYIRPARRTAVWYVLASSALVYTHVWGVFLVISQSVPVSAIVVARRKESRRLLERWLLLQACILAAWTPWLATGFRHQIQRTLHDNSLPYGNLADYQPPSLHAIANGAYLAANTHPIALLFVVIVGLAVAPVVAAALHNERRGAGRVVAALRKVTAAGLADPRLVALAAWYVVPLAIAVIASYLITPVFLQRYTIATTLPVYLVVAVAATSLRSRAVATIGVLLMVAFAAWSTASYVRPLSDFFRAPSEYIKTHAKRNDVVLYDMPPIVFDYYVHRNDLEGTHIRMQQLNLSFITLLRNRRDAIDSQIRSPYTLDSIPQDLKTLRASARFQRVWLLLGPQAPAQLLASTALQRLRTDFGPPVTTRVGSFDIFLFQR
jgi:uncharacterized membrane protein